MKRLYLLRHAKSSWDDPRLSDRERPLAPRGRRSAARIGRYLHQAGMQPEEVLCSSATRTTQTLELILPFLNHGVVVHIEDQLYRADSGELLERAREIPSTVGSAMLIGHNPSIQELALMLLGNPAGNGNRNGSGMAAQLAEKFPTAGLAVLALASDEWSDLGPGEVELERFVTPRQLR